MTDTDDALAAPITKRDVLKIAASVAYNSPPSTPTWVTATAIDVGLMFDPEFEDNAEQHGAVFDD